MPEGPSIVILREELAGFNHKKVKAVSGNAKIDLQRISGKKIIDFKSWGKHFLVCFDDFFLRIHLLMFGSYRINEQRAIAPRLCLAFAKGEINFYNCSIKLIEGRTEDHYNWETDLMSEQWNAKKAEKQLKQLKNANVSDALLNQDVFSGLGNIIKNEVLFRTKIHPASVVAKIPAAKIKELVKESHVYSFEFYKWKTKFELRKHWQIYRQKYCPVCQSKTKTQYVGKTNRLTCFCENCQFLYT